MSGKVFRNLQWVNVEQTCLIAEVLREDGEWVPFAINRPEVPDSNRLWVELVEGIYGTISPLCINQC